jgi:hypothetical protein
MNFRGIMKAVSSGFNIGKNTDRYIMYKLVNQNPHERAVATWTQVGDGDVLVFMKNIILIINYSRREK